MLMPGDVISYREMCIEEDMSMQRGMNYGLRGRHSVILMSVGHDAPYADYIEQNGTMLIYEGHNVPQKRGAADAQKQDQQLFSHVGSLTQNGRFYEAAQDYKAGIRIAELVKVYEKVLSGVWVYNGLFSLTDAWQEWNGTRHVFKFRMEAASYELPRPEAAPESLQHTRLIPANVKLAVWKRDKAQCVLCQSGDNLHFDHIIPFSKGGSSLVADNIQLLCARHNLSKSDKIE